MMRKISPTKYRGYYFIIPFILTITIIRFYLFLFPHVNLYVSSYNVHHLFVGAFFLIIITILLIFNITHPLVIIAAGINSALIVDEITYLIATDGSDLAYFAPISWWGEISITIIIMSIIYITRKIILQKKRRR